MGLLKEVTSKDVKYDELINTDPGDSKLAPKGSSIHIDLQNKAMSDDILKKVEFDLNEIFSDLIHTNPDDVTEKKSDFGDVVTYGKIRFSLDGLNLPSDAKKKLLEKLYFYANRKGLQEFKESTFNQDSRET